MAGEVARVLCVEDSEADHELIVRELEKSTQKFSFLCVDSEGDMRAALQNSKWDIILSDYHMPGFGALRALKILQESKLDIPFVIVSGAIGEEAAIACLKAGASDFVFKDKPLRLESVVLRELREAQQRETKARIQRDLDQTRAQAVFLSEASKILASSLDFDQIVKSACALAVPRISDWCVLDLLQSDGTIKRMAVAHGDSEKNMVAQGLLQYSPVLEKYSEIANAMDYGELRIVEVNEQFLRDRAYNDEHVAIVRSLGAHTMLVVPMRARERTLGTWSFLFSDERYLNGEIIDLAKEFVSRFSMAVDSAQLYLKSQEALASRDEFLSIASHELKTPLTSIKLQLALAERNLERHGSDFSVDKLQKAFEILTRQIDRLASLIDDLLNVSNIQAGRVTYQYEDMNLSELSAEVCEKFALQLKRSSCHVEQAIAPDLNGVWDRSRIEQVLVNLISNACKYAPGSRIILDARRVEDEIEISVQDFGAGIPPEKHPFIFSRYERGAAPTSVAGLGLGLYIVRQIVEAHGGTIKFESQVGKGTKFIIRLPLDSSKGQNREASRAIGK